MRHDDWIDNSEYPDEDDIAAFGEDSPYDDHPLTIGYVGDNQRPLWTPARIGIAFIAVLLICSLLPQGVRWFF